MGGESRGMFDLRKQFVFYASYHNQPVNVAIHLACIWNLREYYHDQLSMVTDNYDNDVDVISVVRHGPPAPLPPACHVPWPAHQGNDDDDDDTDDNDEGTPGPPDRRDAREPDPAGHPHLRGLLRGHGPGGGLPGRRPRAAAPPVDRGWVPVLAD